MIGSPGSQGRSGLPGPRTHPPAVPGVQPASAPLGGAGGQAALGVTVRGHALSCRPLLCSSPSQAPVPPAARPPTSSPSRNSRGHAPRGSQPHRRLALCHAPQNQLHGPWSASPYGRRGQVPPKAARLVPLAAGPAPAAWVPAGGAGPRRMQARGRPGRASCGRRRCSGGWASDWGRGRSCCGVGEGSPKLLSRRLAGLKQPSSLRHVPGGRE